MFKTKNLPIKVDDFVQKLIHYYKGDNFLIQNTEFLTKKSINDNNEKIMKTYTTKSIWMNMKIYIQKQI